LRISAATTEKPRPCSPARGLDRGVERQQVGLARYLGDHVGDAADLRCLLVQVKRHLRDGVDLLVQAGHAAQRLGDGARALIGERQHLSRADGEIVGLLGGMVRRCRELFHGGGRLVGGRGLLCGELLTLADSRGDVLGGFRDRVDCRFDDPSGPGAQGFGHAQRHQDSGDDARRDRSQRGQPAEDNDSHHEAAHDYRREAGNQAEVLEFQSFRHSGHARRRPPEGTPAPLRTLLSVQRVSLLSVCARSKGKRQRSKVRAKV
jgi:hypothetical protein